MGTNSSYSAEFDGGEAISVKATSAPEQVDGLDRGTASGAGAPVRGTNHRLSIHYQPLESLRPAARNPRIHKKKQIRQIAASIRTFGFNVPILVDGSGTVIAGHARLLAAAELKLADVPTVRLEHLSAAEIKAFMIADNRLAEIAIWDDALLAETFRELAAVDLSFDLDVTGFAVTEIDLLVLGEGAPAPDARANATVAPDPSGMAVTQPGDLWLLDRHRLVCSDARDPAAYAALMEGAKAQMVFTDPPYNVPITGHVSGLGQVRHREFAMASGEMSEAEFVAFLDRVMAQMVAQSADGALHYLCMDWRHLFELLSATRRHYTALMNLCVWNKTNGGMGSLYRSKHELVAVCKVGTAPHRNNVELGKHGRYRTNVWDYAGVNTFRTGREDELAMHPTVKPAEMVADAILDVTRRGEVVLDPFAGSGTTVIAAERTGRIARVIEIDPLYADTIIRRWQTYTGEIAVHAGSRLAFADRAAIRRDPPAAE